MQGRYIRSSLTGGLRRSLLGSYSEWTGGPQPPGPFINLGVGQAPAASLSQAILSHLMPLHTTGLEDAKLC